MTIYDDMRGIAADLMNSSKLGQSGIVYVAVTPGTGPADNPGVPTTTDHPVKGVARGVQFKYVNNSIVMASDMQVTAANDGTFTPDMHGKIRIGSITYKIVQINPVPAAGNPITWVIIIRK